MKKQLLLLAFVIIASVSYAQNASYGMRVGMNSSNLSYDPDLSYDPAERYGFAIGFFAEYDLSDSFAIAPEIQYSAEGRKHRTLRVDFIQVPVMFKYRLGSRFAIGAGPMVGVKIHEYEDGFNNFNYAAAGGIEFMITDEFFIDARYHYGFNDLLDNPDSDLEARNRAVQVTLGVKF
ncbi:porin family protein [Bizionia sp. KMM 8389]